MNNLVIIAAIGKNNELGKDNKLIWHLPNDLKFFKKNTLDKTIVMGYNTFKSLPKLLPGRKHIVLTHKEVEFPDGIDIYHDKDSLLRSLNNYSDDIFVIGGALIYGQFINDADKLILTEIDREEKDADVYFPVFNKEDFDSKVIGENEDNGIKYKHLEYRRKR
jgi:dihydrofolate reductase